MTDPQQALDACRQAGLTEGQWVEDVRAGRCQITEMTTTAVTVTTDDGQPIAIATTELYDSYQNGSLQLAEGHT